MTWIAWERVVLLTIVVAFAWYRLDTAVRHGVDAADGVECPTCGGESVREVATSERLSSALLGGLLFSRAARKRFECRECGCLW